MVGFLLAWVFITLAPASSFVPVASEVGAERRMYLPLAGLVVLFMIGAHQALQRLRPYGTYAVAGLISIVLAYGTVVRARDYLDLKTLAQTTVDRWPNGRGYYHLAIELYEEGNTAEAMRLFELSARDFPGGRYALGVEYASRNQPDAALEQLGAFVRDAPTHSNAPAAHDLMARLLLNEGRIAEGIRHLDEAMKWEDYPQRAQVMRLREQAASLGR
jgi:tetratricopeptide (TPR) repeat protein